jgi:excisionase family DNA binding protein
VDFELGRRGLAFPSQNWQHNMNERWLSVEEIAAHLGVNPDTIYKWIERKKMPAHKVGRLWKFQATEVDAWIRDGRASEPVNEAGEQPEV